MNKLRPEPPPPPPPPPMRQIKEGVCVLVPEPEVSSLRSFFAWWFAQLKGVRCGHGGGK